MRAIRKIDWTKSSYGTPQQRLLLAELKSYLDAIRDRLALATPNAAGPLSNIDLWFAIESPKDFRTRLAIQVKKRDDILLRDGQGRAPVAFDPRPLAEFFLALLLNKARGDALIGDLNQRYEDDCRRFGSVRARNRYLGRALKSFSPLLRRAAERLIRWGMALGAVAEIVRRFKS